MRVYVSGYIWHRSLAYSFYCIYASQRETSICIWCLTIYYIIECSRVQDAFALFHTHTSTHTHDQLCLALTHVQLSLCVSIWCIVCRICAYTSILLSLLRFVFILVFYMLKSTLMMYKWLTITFVYLSIYLYMNAIHLCIHFVYVW